jgi:hypothetical protein
MLITGIKKATSFCMLIDYLAEVYQIEEFSHGVLRVC